MKFKRSLCIVFIFIISQIAMSQDLSNVPTVQDLSVDSQIAEIDSTVNTTIPDTLDNDLIPNETATQLFAYMKWMFSDTAANELLGQTLAPIGLELYLLLLLAITFTLLWLTIRMLVLTWRLFLFIVSWIIKLIELVPVFE